MSFCSTCLNKINSIVPSVFYRESVNVPECISSNTPGALNGSGSGPGSLHVPSGSTARIIGNGDLSNPNNMTAAERKR
jgi:hypothetical protein